MAAQTVWDEVSLSDSSPRERWCGSDIDEQVARAAAEIGGAGGVPCDVSTPGAIDGVIRQMVERHGGLDVAVANAGIGGRAPVVEMSDEQFRRILAVNLEGVFFTCRAAARVMLGQRSGVIVTVSSVFGRDTPAGSGAYGASKAGVIALTQALARELAPAGIRVNCVSPGHMATDLYWAALQRRAAMMGQTFEEAKEAERSSVPLGRLGTAADVAGLVAFLGSDDAAYITGQTINVDGGLQMR
ncbi:MAG: hypothetical protein C4345_05340 [Chloroflexota bacterium]